MIAVAPRSSLISVTARAATPMVQGLSSEQILYLAGTPDRPRINIRDWQVDILPGVPFEVGGLLAETGDQLLTESGDQMITEDI